MTLSIRTHKWLILILVVALTLRLGYALTQDHKQPYILQGGDTGWYLETGYDLVNGRDRAPLSPAPLYLIFIGFWETLLSPRTAEAIIAIRVSQALMATLTCYFGFCLARRLAQNQRAGVLAAAILAVSPVFIIETAQILTETLYVFLITGVLWLYEDYILPDDITGKRRAWALIITGIAAGLATLTRAVFLFFPLGIALHLVVVRGRRAGLKQAGLFLLTYTIVVSTWTIYNLHRWDRFVIGGDGFASFLYIGARGWEGPQELDATLNNDVPEISEEEATSPNRQEAFMTGASRAISEDPAGYVKRRVAELVEAYLQPHGTAVFSGEGLKDLVRDWFDEDRTARGLFELTEGEWFWPKLGLYIFHYIGLILGAAGIWLYRRRWSTAYPLSGFILYTTLIHLVMLALPRYLFPTEIFWWIFAVSTLFLWWDKRLPTVEQAESKTP
jgi:4-amino-4-deoxy-L-arabinose transferase-like glycosyltransferase